MRKKVLLIHPTIHEIGLRRLEREVDIVLAPNGEKETIREYIAEADGMINRTHEITEEIIAGASKLKVIGQHGTGTDYIDVEAASKRGIAVVNAPRANYLSVAEYTIMVILALSYKLLVADRYLRAGKWTMRNRLDAHELQGRKAGIVGLGRIGREVARKCILAFGIEVCGFDPYVSEDQLMGLDITLCNNLEELLSKSDFVTIHVPLTQRTRGLIGKKEISQMKRTAYLINASRGGVIDEEALIEMLQSDKIAGAALDVFEKEPPDQDNPLLKTTNTILTPHSASRTEEAKIRMALQVVEEVLKVLRGEQPTHIANPEVLARS